MLHLRESEADSRASPRGRSPAEEIVEKRPGPLPMRGSAAVPIIGPPTWQVPRVAEARTRFRDATLRLGRGPVVRFRRAEKDLVRRTVDARNDDLVLPPRPFRDFIALPMEVQAQHRTGREVDHGDLLNVLRSASSGNPARIEPQRADAPEGR